ncbi:MAG: YfiR family protein [Mariprofundales bacterium]|nr:YfiR family protein [Mariprofundales bacterium]
MVDQARNGDQISVTAGIKLLPVWSAADISMTTICRGAIGSLLYLLSILVSGVTVAAEVDENSLQVLYLRNFISYIDWPDGYTPTSMVLVDKGGSSSLLQSMRAKHTFPLEHSWQCSTAVCIAEADLLFIDRYYSDIAGVLRVVDGKPKLTVSNRPGFVDIGGMIGFVRRNDHLHFEINLHAFQRARLHVSAEMLQMALRVVGRDAL